MTTIKDLLSTGHWTDYFLEKPLTFSEFVATSDLPKTAFKTTLEFFDTVDDNIQYQYYFQGCVGSGKSIIIHTLCAYKLYLFCLLRDPHKTFSHAPTTKYSFGIISTKKSSDLALSSLLQIMEMFPIFKKNKYEIDDGPVGYSLNCNNALMRLQYVTKEGIRGADIHVIAMSTPGDLMGTNIVGVLGTELIAFLQDTEMSEDDLFSFINKIRSRIDTRMRDELPIKCLFIEKAPYDLEKSPIDNYLLNSYQNDPNVKVVRLGPIWKIHPDKYDMSDTGDIPYFDMETLSVSYNVSSKDGCVRIPKDLVSNATKKPELFLRDYIGLPTSILQNEQIKLLKNLHNAILLNDLRITLYNGVFYLVDRNGHKEDIHDLFRPF